MAFNAAIPGDETNSDTDTEPIRWLLFFFLLACSKAVAAGDAYAGYPCLMN
jgi:hypothetical protein